MKYQQLTEGQRYQISVLREDNLSCSVNRPGFPGECFVCELRLPDLRL